MTDIERMELLEAIAYLENINFFLLFLLIALAVAHVVSSRD